MEELSGFSWAGICGCFTGNALVAHPPFIFGGHGDWGLDRIGGVLAAVASNVCMGCAFILIRSFLSPLSNSVTQRVCFAPGTLAKVCIALYCLRTCISSAVS